MKMDELNTMDRERMIIMMDIDRKTRLGNEDLRLGDVEQSVDKLQQAYQLARQLDDDVTERCCAFNLGAVYIASRQAEKGLEYLQRAVPPMNKRDGVSNADLYQNFALGYEILDNRREMVRYFQLALDEYRRENISTDVEISIGLKLASALSSSGEHEKAGEAYDRLAELFDKISDRARQTDVLLLRCKQLAKCQDTERHLAALDRCLETCHLMTDDDSKKSECRSFPLSSTDISTRKMSNRDFPVLSEWFRSDFRYDQIFDFHVQKFLEKFSVQISFV